MATAPRRWRKRYIIPITIVSLLLIVLLVAYVRGTWGTADIRDPVNASDGVVCYLHKPADGSWQVRCSMILEHPPEKVWQVVSDYDNFARIFPTLESCKAEYRDGGKVRLTGTAHSSLGIYPFDIVVKHTITPDSLYQSSWDGGSGDVQKLKGSWTVTPATKARTLLVYNSHTEIKGYPDWVVVNALLLRQPKVIKAVGDWLAKEGR